MQVYCPSRSDKQGDVQVQLSNIRCSFAMTQHQTVDYRMTEESESKDQIYTISYDRIPGMDETEIPKRK